MAHIVVLMGSPRPDGNTARLVAAFAEGAAERHTVEILSPARMTLHPCKGCNSCFRHPDNRCVLQDDMQSCYQRLAGADILVIATPLYFYSVSAQLKLLIDRLHNPIRSTFRVRTLVLLAVAGNADPAIFEPLLAMYHRTRNYFHLADGGVLTVPGVRARTDIVGHPALEQARQLGAQL